MALPEELNLLQVLKGMDERPQCSYCYGRGRKKKKDGKYARRRDSTNKSSSDYDEAKVEAPANAVILVESNPTVVDELKTIFSDPNPEITRNTKVRRIMMIKDIEPKIRQQAVMAIMQGKGIAFADERKNLKTKQKSKVNIGDSEETFLDEIVTEWESDEGLLERGHTHHLQPGYEKIETEILIYMMKRLAQHLKKPMLGDQVLLYK